MAVELVTSDTDSAFAEMQPLKAEMMVDGLLSLPCWYYTCRHQVIMIKFWCALVISQCFPTTPAKQSLNWLCQCKAHPSI